MFDPNADAPPLNPIPQAVILLAVLVGAPEVIFQLGEAGLIGGPQGATWRQAIANQFGFANNVLFLMWETGQYSTDMLLRFVTYMFVDVSFVAVLFSVVFVLALGKFLGDHMAQMSILVIFFASGVGGAVIQALINGPNQAMLGASAASFGLIGALSWVLFSQQRAGGESGFKAFRLIAQLAVFLGVMAYLFGGNGWVDCVAGVCVGFPMAAFLRPVEGRGVSFWFERMRSR